VTAIPGLELASIPNWRRDSRGLRRIAVLMLAALSLLAPVLSYAQDAAPAKPSPESELIFEGQGSFGNYKIFAAGEGSHLFTGGVEYQRHSWGSFLGSRVFYVGEFLPVAILNEPAKLNYYGVPRSTNRQYVPGIGVLPIGFRLLWLDGHAVAPYIMAKGGMFGFTEKVLSPHGSYEDFILHSEIGVEVRMTDRTNLRLGMGDFHFSNSFIVPSNPGLDVMSYDAGICYRLHRPSR